MTITPGDKFPYAKCDKPGQVACLRPGDELAISISGFEAGSTIGSIKFYEKASNEGDFNVMPFRIWNPASPAGVDHTAQNGKVTRLFTVRQDSPTTFVLTNNAAAGSDTQHVWFAVMAGNPGGSGGIWTLDPEVVNTGGGDRAGFQSPAAGDGSQTLGV
jgi:hypothetical protein